MTLYVGKLIIDEVVLVAGGGAAGGLAAWRTDGRLHPSRVAAGGRVRLAVASDVLGRR
ncbi:MAG: hypothetical protein IPK33_11435 [Gemmatimonadetes bacterium]|nr:hypothetical protein [Gemmatimonadota bacterium]